MHLESEGKCRSKANELMGEVDLTVEMVQTTNIEEGQCVVKPAALCRVKNPLAMIFDHLDHLKEKGALTWHDNDGNSMLKRELWIKFGGDKGGGSFKFCQQIVNHTSPNSAYHTAVPSCLLATDSLNNMHLAMDYFKTAIEELNGMERR